jgi:hypothetical protein
MLTLWPGWVDSYGLVCPQPAEELVGRYPRAVPLPFVLFAALREAIFSEHDEDCGAKFILVQLACQCSVEAEQMVTKQQVKYLPVCICHHSTRWCSRRMLSDTTLARQ